MRRRCAIAVVIAATSCSPQSRSTPQGAAATPSTSVPASCRRDPALGFVFEGPEAPAAASDLRALVAERKLDAEVTEKPGKVIVLLYRGAVDDKENVVQRARARDMEFAIETRVDVGADCELRWLLAPGSTPP